MRMLALTCIPIIGLTGCMSGTTVPANLAVLNYSEPSDRAERIERAADTSKDTSQDGNAPW